MATSAQPLLLTAATDDNSVTRYTTRTGSTASSDGGTRKFSCPCKYRVQKVLSKGVILLLVWNAIFWFSSPEPYLPYLENYAKGNSLLHLPVNVPKPLFHNLAISAYLFYPLIGWIADSKFGRYKVILASLYTIFALNFVLTMAYIVRLTVGSSFAVTYNAEHLLRCVLTLAFGGIHATMIPFIVDQLLGLSGEQLSAAIHWYFFSEYLGLLLDIIIPCFFGMSNALFFGLVVAQCLLLLCVIISTCVLHRWFDTTPQISNPVKQIFLVLNYARKNKWPRNRSALTYIDEEQPTRLDNGKTKFGGPFSEEQVQDVKTILRLLPLLPLMVFLGISIEPGSFVKHLNVSAIHVKQTLSIPLQISYCLLDYRYSVFFAVTVIFIPIYQFLIYPFFYKYVPSILKRIGVGLFITTTGMIGYLIIDTIGHLRNPNIGCMFNSSTEETHLNIDMAWVLIPQLAIGVGDMLALVSSLEFVCAQSPASMRGLMIGLWFTAIGVMDLVGLNLHFMFQYIPVLSTAQPSCGVYYYATKITLSCVLLILFVILANRYTYREPNKVVNLQFITEEHYERYIEAEAVYERGRLQRGSASDNSSSMMNASRVDDSLNDVFYSM